MEIRIPEGERDTHLFKATSIETEYPFLHTPISWSAVFAGLVTAFATSICLSFLVVALGLGQIDLYSSSPFEGVFLSIGIGSLIIMLLSLASGGFIAGRFADMSGTLHGFLTWALLTLIIAIQTIFFASSAANLGAKAILNSGSAIQQTVANLDTDSFPLLSKLGSENFLNGKDGNGVDFDKLRSQLREFLNKSDIPALNPDRLKQVYKAAIKDIGSAIMAFKDDPSHYRTHLKNLSTRLSDHIQDITKNIDRDDIVNALINNGMTRAEAEKTTDQALDVYQTAKTKTEQTIKALEQQIDTLSKKLDTLAKDARDTADQAAKTASHIGWWSFFGSLIGAIVASLFGYYGYKSRKIPLHI
ncbi:DUF3792 domain-containing protein [Bartonella sp. B17]